MHKRLIACSPREMIALSPSELFHAIRLSEGRMVEACAGAPGDAAFPGATNAEVCASFGADIVSVDLLGSVLGASTDHDLALLADQVGELRRVAGRPVSCHVRLAGKSAHAGGLVGRAEVPTVARRLSELGVDMVLLDGAPEDAFFSALEESSREVGERALFGAAFTGDFEYAIGDRPVSAEDVRRAVAAGARVVGVPAVGSVPGYSQGRVSKLVDAAHQGGALASVVLSNALEDADRETVLRIAIDNKQAGPDLYTYGSVADGAVAARPEQLMGFCISLKGHRHTYRRLAESVLR